MILGVPREIKVLDGRVALLPQQVKRLSDAGHHVYIEQRAGELSGARDKDYQAAGAEVLGNVSEVYDVAPLIAKVMEPHPQEFRYIRKEHVLVAKLHTALNRPLTDRLLECGATAFSIEELHAASPESPLAGEVAALEGVRLCLAPYGGSGRHFMPHYKSPTLSAVVIGLGAAGNGALRVLTRLGCDAMGFDKHRDARVRAELTFVGSSYDSAPLNRLSAAVRRADLVINCVRWDKSKQGHIITRDMVRKMKDGAVIVDVSCDEHGAVETSRPTTWEDPVFEVDGVRHFCVDNLAGAVPVAASTGYAATILPVLLSIAEHGALEACRRDPDLAQALTCSNGVLVLEETAKVQKREHTPVDQLLAQAPAKRVGR